MFCCSAPKGPRSLARTYARLQSRSVPELPDLAVVADALHAALAGRSVERAESPGALSVRGTPAELQALVGQRLRRVRRRGKFLVFDLARDRVAINAMLTGRLQLAAPADKRPPNTAVVLAFGSRARGPRDAAAWTKRGAWLPGDAASAEIRYRDPSQMGKVYVLPAGVARPVAGFEDGEQGPDADDPALTLEVWKERIRRHPGELKSLLRNQAFVAGIGNAYSDEILHAAKLSPFRRRSSLAPEEIEALYTATGGTLERAIEILRERVPPTFEKQVRDFLAVHLRGGEPCPRCGTRLSEVSSRSEATTWCRGCQS